LSSLLPQPSPGCRAPPPSRACGAVQPPCPGTPGSSFLPFALRTGALPGVLTLVSEDPKASLLPRTLRPHAQYPLYALESLTTTGEYRSVDGSAVLDLRLNGTSPTAQLSCSTRGPLHCQVSEQDGRPQFDIST
jgi:hypothetical protein